MKILIADDDPISRRVLEAALRRQGHCFQTATNGEEAWSLFLRDGADVILSDWMMPGIDGIELCRRIRAAAADHQGSPYTYFLLLTSLEDRSHFMSGMRAGADDYLVKPLNPVDLEARLMVAERVTRLHHEMQTLNRKLWDQARRDALTDLYNRLQLRDDLDTLRDSVERERRPRTLALCDVDNFKRYNDHYGHLAGDEALRHVATALRTAFSQSLQENGRVYRYGGEEFCLLLDASGESAREILENTRCRVADREIPHIGNQPSGLVTVSIGMSAIRPGDDRSMDSVLQEADMALYAAKLQGRNRVMEGAAPAILAGVR